MGSGPLFPAAQNDSAGIVECNFAFDTDAANAPTLHTTDNKIVKSVARTGTGQYTVTLREGFQSLKAALFTAMFATPIDLVPQVKSADVSSAKTVVISLLAAATPTDPPAKGTNAGTIFGTLKLRNSVVK